MYLRGSLARTVKAGDSVSVAGIFLPEPYSGPQAMLRASLLTSTHLQAMHIQQNKISYQVCVEGGGARLGGEGGGPPGREGGRQQRWAGEKRWVGAAGEAGASGG